MNERGQTGIAGIDFSITCPCVCVFDFDFVDKFEFNKCKFYFLIKKKKWLARRRELYNWHRRAAVVGIASLPPKKVSKGTRIEWEMAVIRAEEEQLNTNAES